MSIGPRSCRLDRVVEPRRVLAGDAGLVGAVAQILDGDAVEALHDLVLQLEPERPHHLAAELGAALALDRVLAALERAHDADDLADADAAALARQAVAAARAAHAR